MTKEELIKEVCGDYYESYISKENPIAFIEMESLGILDKLDEINHNEGWIKIESEEDLPEKGEYYWTVTDKNKTPPERWFNKDWIINDGDGKITHYQPVIKPKPHSINYATRNNNNNTCN